MSARGTGPWTRIAIAAQVTLMVVLATVLAAVCVWLARRPSLHVRWDLTADRRGTLSPVVAELCAQIPDHIDVDIFFTPLPQELADTGGYAQGLMRELLFIARNQYPTKLSVVDHDVSDVAEARTRMAELGVFEENVVVLRRAGLKAVIRLFRDAAEIEWRAPGPGQPAVPELAAFKGQEALGVALRRVLAERAPRVLFSTGQGERDVWTGGDTQLEELRRLLETDGFRVATWNPAEETEVPADCDVLAICGPKQPFAPSALNAIRRFVGRGGRLVCAPDPSAATGAGSVGELLAGFGIDTLPGLVCRPTVDRFGRRVLEGRDCLDLRLSGDGLNSNHPVTRPLWRARQGVRFVGAHAFQRGRVPVGGAYHELAYATDGAWLDLPGPDGTYDWKFDPARGEEQARRVVAAAVELPVTEPAPESAQGESAQSESAGSQSAQSESAQSQSTQRDASRGGAGGGAAGGPVERPRGRVLAVGSPEVFISADALFSQNQGFLLNVFNWLASREYLITIDRVQVERPRLDVTGGRALATVQALSTFALPFLCLLAGLLLWWRRSR